jgi:hypothetical protein
MLVPDSPAAAPAEAQREAETRVVAEPTRRVILAAVAAGSLGLAGCKGLAALGPLPGLPPDVVVLERAIEAEQIMVARYAEALGSLATFTGTQADTGIAHVVADIHAEHEAHLRQLRARLVLPPRLAGTKLGRSRTPSSALPDSASGALGALAAGEQAAAARLTGELLTVPGALAQLMASIAASEAAHVVYLRTAGRP